MNSTFLFAYYCSAHIAKEDHKFYYDSADGPHVRKTRYAMLSGMRLFQDYLKYETTLKEGEIEEFHNRLTITLAFHGKNFGNRLIYDG